jgi:GT2 family glycosyltransferase
MWDSERERVVDWAIAAFVMVRRDAWEEIGGFDEQQWMYAEDLDLGWQVARTGRHTRFVPQAVVKHHESASARQAWGEERTARWMASTYAWMLRRRGPVRTRATAALNVAGALARAGFARSSRRRAANMRWARLHRIGLRPRGELERHR